ncbi:NlpC/P60 family protein [Sulfurovum sp. XGS-02]|uniref:NlpC/P60 family protein n=1 Tax=Sulfurovum sp. XGS-02 TaxID=2925411 RepID=UPI00204B334B|nr:NlpC/P60 family protein [Sulfurovum sp. XGS-02]UPT77926.1 NlpC/P60 family protein [Sulfurovum sp. XGS-02]
MKKITSLSFTFTLILLFNGCKPDPHPKNPNYAIQKPMIKCEPTKENLDKMVKELQGKPYVWAEEGPDQFDCSGFTYYLYGSMGIEIPRVAREQAKNGNEIKMDELVYGDLIFFDTEKHPKGNITHVGMYLGNGWFTHASTTEYEIVYSNLNTSPYYKKRLRICRRYLPDAKEKIAMDNTKPWKTKETLKAKVDPVTALPKVTQKHGLGNFYVQVGSFSGRPQDALLHKITRAGYHYKLIAFPLHGKEITKLLIGPYRQRADAVALLEQIRTQIQKDAFIAEIR